MGKGKGMGKGMGKGKKGKCNGNWKKTIAVI
jgi:hypothetical protein